MSKRLLSLLLSLLLLVGVVNVPVGATTVTEPKEITITLDYQDKLPYHNPDDITGFEDDKIFDKDLPTPNRTGYEFMGWYTTATGGNKITENTQFKSLTTNTLYAHWNPLPVSVILNYAYTDAPSAETRTCYYEEEYGKYQKLPVPTRTGYTFEGWFTEQNGKGSKITDSSTVRVTTTQNLYAYWTVQVYNVTFNPGNGQSNTTGTYTIGSTVTGFPADPVRTGYEFKGWFKEGDTSATPQEYESSTVMNETGISSLVAKWEAKSYKIDFQYKLPTDNTNITKPSDITGKDIKYDEPYRTAMPTPLPSVQTPTYKVGEKDEKYTFAGWYPQATDSPANEDYDTPAVVCTPVPSTAPYTTDGASTLYARWSYKVAFDVGKAAGRVTAPAARTYTSGTAYDTLPTFALNAYPGHTFEGWYASKTENNNTVTLSEKVTADSIADPKYKTLYAKWDAAEITITLDPGKGTLPQGQETIKRNYDDTYVKAGGALPTPTRTGYSFEGWYLDAACTDGKKVESTTKVENTKGHRLYAKWTAKDVTIAFVYLYPNGEKDDAFSPSETMRAYDAEYGNALAIGPANTDAYTFDGWYTTADDKDTKGVRLSSDSTIAAPEVTEGANGDLTVTVYARWKYGIEFYANYPGASSDPYRMEYYISGYLFGDKVQPGLPEKPDGYENGAFTGWYTTAADTEYGKGQLVNEESFADGKDLQLYARWGDRYCTIKLDPDKGTMPAGRPAQDQIPYGDPYGSLVETVPTREGYEFAGWYTENGQKIESATEVDDDYTLYAHWTPTKVNVYVDGAEYQVDYNTLFSDFEAEHNTKTGFNFGGWFTDQDCTYSFSKPTQIIRTFSIYAKWIASVTVTLDPLGGEMPSDAITIVEVNSDGSGTYPAAFPSPTKPGYTFRGWYDTTDYKKGRQAEAGQLPLTKNNGSPVTTLYAGWDACRVTVHFDYNGINQTEPAEDRTYDYNAPHTYLPAPYPIGHVFIGWFTDPVDGTQVKLGNPVLPSDPSAEALTLTLYAHWGYRITFIPGDMPDQIAPVNQAFTIPSPDSSVIPPDGMRFDHWKVNFDNNLTLMPGDTYIFPRPAVLTAVWSDKPFTIAVSSSGGGYITTTGSHPFGDITVKPGETVTFVIRPYSGYELKELIVDGESIPAPMGTYSFKKIKDDHSISAVFQRIPLPAYASCAQNRSCPLSRFSDLNPKAWYHDAVHYCLDNVIMNGCSDTIYRPNSYITRAELTQALWNASGRFSPLGSNTGFVYQYRDVSPKDWFYSPVVWATNEGIVNGFGNGIFGPNRNITREQLVTILWRQAGSPSASMNTLLSFYDCETVSSYAFNAMAWATENHIISGRAVRTIDPKGYATRAEVATILKNYLE